MYLRYNDNLATMTRQINNKSKLKIRTFYKSKKFDLKNF